jgi:penicillin-binding protein 2
MALAALQTQQACAPAWWSTIRASTTSAATRFRSHEGGLGGVDMHRAIQLSSNTYFYSLAVDMGVDTIHDFMKPLGFGQITGIDLQRRGARPAAQHRPGSARPTSVQSMKKWYAGETMSLGIGQGYNSLHHAAARGGRRRSLANGGIKHRPHVVKATSATRSAGEVNELAAAGAGRRASATSPSMWTWCATRWWQ